jgi:hypothetical protein
MPETGEKSVARRIFFKDSETAGSSVFMRAPHSSVIKVKCSKQVTAEDVMSVTRLIARKIRGAESLQAFACADREMPGGEALRKCECGY